MILQYSHGRTMAILDSGPAVIVRTVWSAADAGRDGGGREDRGFAGGLEI